MVEERWVDGNQRTILLSVSNAINYEMPCTCIKIQPGRSMDDHAFFGSRDTLISVNFSPNLEIIGAFAFSNCKNLQNVDLEKCTKLIRIENRAFVLCTAITSLSLPSSLIELEGTIFDGTNFPFVFNFTIRPNLKSIKFSCFGINPIEYSIEKDVTLFNLYHGCVYNQNYSILLSVSALVTDIVFHESVNKIESSGLISAQAKYIKLPDSINFIERYSIMFCRKLEILILSPNINQLHEYAGIPRHAFDPPPTCKDNNMHSHHVSYFLFIVFIII